MKAMKCRLIPPVRKRRPLSLLPCNPVLQGESACAAIALEGQKMMLVEWRKFPCHHDVNLALCCSV